VAAQVASTDPPAAPGATITTHPAASTATPQSPLEQEVEVLKARIDQLEKEVQLEHNATLQSSSDAAALSAAERNLLGPNQPPALHAAAPAGTPATLKAIAQEPAAPAGHSQRSPRPRIL
jgi:hypothetical protein